jgi:hypothetical protein
MSDLAERIQRLDPAAAERILRTVAQHSVASGSAQRLEADADFKASLSAAAELTATPASAGEVARAALLVLADDPAQRPALEPLVDHPPPETAQTYVDPANMMILSTAALVVLQAHIKVEKTPKGWVFKFEKKPMANSLLAQFIAKLIGLR